jgi:hypothetical protein
MMSYRTGYQQSKAQTQARKQSTGSREPAKKMHGYLLYDDD